MNGVVICDLDGTLIDSRADLTAAVNLVRAEYGLSAISINLVTSYVGDGVKKLIERALVGADADLDQAVESMRHHYSKGMLNETYVYSSVFEGLDMLKKAGFKLAIATNKPQKACTAIVKALDLYAYFDVILGGTGDYPLKPDPAMLFLAMKQTGTTLRNSWMVGDNHTDLASGRKAGVKTCYVNYGFGEIGDESFDIQVDSFVKFAEMIC
jgi:phosphoglycolate phosphatase